MRVSVPFLFYLLPNTTVSEMALGQFQNKNILLLFTKIFYLFQTFSLNPILASKRTLDIPSRVLFEASMVCVCLKSNLCTVGYLNYTKSYCASFCFFDFICLEILFI